jgi:hypothetical protein
MKYTKHGYHGAQHDREHPASFRNPQKNRCGICIRLIPKGEDFIIEMRPTGNHFQLQKHYYCMKCKEEFLSDETILHCDPESLSGTGAKSGYFYQKNPQTISEHSCGMRQAPGSD